MILYAKSNGAVTIFPHHIQLYMLRKLLLSSFKAIIVVLVLFIASSELSAQKVKPEGYRKNAIYGSVGFAGLYGTITGNYERIITQSLDKTLSATFIKTGFGGYAAYADEGNYIYLQYGILLGKRTSHLELSAGPHYIFEGSMDSPIGATVGYRAQKPGNRFMFRTGVAYPESFYLGFGLSF